MIHLLAIVSLIVLLTGCSGAAKPTGQANQSDQGLPQPIVSSPEARNSGAAQSGPYVVLVSIDGFRHDYLKHFEPPNLLEISRRGVRAEGLIPVFPSTTYPNHYAMVTGQYANNHGIVSNTFYDPQRQEIFSMSDQKSLEDGTWYFGAPLWTVLQKSGFLSASFFWVGSEANILGSHPQYYYRYDSSVLNEVRVRQVLKWLQMPVEKRPHFITLYFSEVDSVGHQFGPSAPQTREAVLVVDEQIGQLRAGLKNLGLPVHLLIVSDHGMLDLDSKKVVLIDEDPIVRDLLPKFKVVGRGPIMQVYLNEGENKELTQRLRQQLQRNARHYKVLRQKDLRRLHFDGLARMGDIVLESEPPYLLGLRGQRPVAKGGNHGWDPTKTKAMWGTFLAEGPLFKAGVSLPAFENIHIYPLILKLFAVKTSQSIDGRLHATKAALR